MVFVHHPAESCFVHCDLLDFGVARGFGRKFHFDFLVRGVEFLEKSRADGEQVAAGQFTDLPSVSERRAHDDGFEVELLVVVVNTCDRHDSGISCADILNARVVLLIPVEDSAHERRDQSYTSFGARDGLSEAEQQRQVAVNVVLAFEDARGFDSFPGRRQFDQDAVARNSKLFIHVDKLDCFLDGRVAVEGKSGIDFGGNATGNDVENFATEKDEKLIGSFGDLVVNVAKIKEENENILSISRVFFACVMRYLLSVFTHSILIWERNK